MFNGKTSDLQPGDMYYVTTTDFNSYSFVINTDTKLLVTCILVLGIEDDGSLIRIKLPLKRGTISVDRATHYPKAGLHESLAMTIIRL